jgi:hypothetical protein
MWIRKVLLLGLGLVLLVFSTLKYFHVNKDIAVLQKVDVWDETPAVVKTYKVVNLTQGSQLWFLAYPPKGNDVIAEYTYKYNGVDYNSTNVWPCPPSYLDALDLRNRLKSAEDMWRGRTTCFVNPSSPEESILTRGIYKLRIQGQAKVFGFIMALGLAFSVLPVFFLRRKPQVGFKTTNEAYWARVDHLEMVNGLAKQIVMLLIAGFLMSNLFSIPGGLKLKDSSDLIRLSVSFILFIATFGYAIKIFFPWFRGRACRLKLNATSYQAGEPVRMTLCIGHPLPEGGEAVLTLRCQRPRMEDERSFRIHVTLFEKKKRVKCPMWIVPGEELEIPVEFEVSEDLSALNFTIINRDGVRWVVSVKIQTPKVSYQSAFVIPIKAK